MKNALKLLSVLMCYSQLTYANPLKGIGSELLKLGGQQIENLAKPYLCVTSDPWNNNYEGRGQTLSQAERSAISNCGIFTRCSQNVSCEKVSTAFGENSYPQSEKSGDQTIEARQTLYVPVYDGNKTEVSQPNVVYDNSQRRAPLAGDYSQPEVKSDCTISAIGKSCAVVTQNKLSIAEISGSQNTYLANIKIRTYYQGSIVTCGFEDVVKNANGKLSFKDANCAFDIIPAINGTMNIKVFNCNNEYCGRRIYEAGTSIGGTPGESFKRMSPKDHN